MIVIFFVVLGVALVVVVARPAVGLYSRYICTSSFFKIGLRCERKKERNTYVGNSETFQRG